MKNYERYDSVTDQEYDKKTIMDYFCRIPSDRKIVPLISEIKDKKILDVGLGTGRYTKILVKNNEVTGVDQNPHLCKLDIELHRGDAGELSKLVEGEKFDLVFSTWMTEYLDEKALGAFFSEARKVIQADGKLITTIISRYGLGFMYVTLARKLRGILKYNYRKKDVVDKLREAGFGDIQIVNLDSWLYFPWAYMIIAE